MSSESRIDWSVPQGLTLTQAKALLPAFVLSARAAFWDMWNSGSFTPSECLTVARRQARTEGESVSLRLRRQQWQTRKE